MTNFKQLPNDPYHYINDKGEIYSMKTGQRHDKKPTINAAGYHVICIYQAGGKRAQYKVHRLVAEAFIPNPNQYKIVNHKDGNKLNNIVENLEWTTHTGNLQHAYDTGLHNKGEKAGMAKFTDNNILSALRMWKEGSSKSAAARAHGISPAHFIDITNGKCRKDLYPVI